MLIPSSRAVRKRTDRWVSLQAEDTHTHSSLSAVGAFPTMTFSLNMPLSYSSTRPEPAQPQAPPAGEIPLTNFRLLSVPAPLLPHPKWAERARRKKSWSKLAKRNTAATSKEWICTAAVRLLNPVFPGHLNYSEICPWVQMDKTPRATPPLPTPIPTDRHKWNGALGNIHQDGFFRWLRSLMPRDHPTLKSMEPHKQKNRFPHLQRQFCRSQPVTQRGLNAVLKLQYQTEEDNEDIKRAGVSLTSLSMWMDAAASGSQYI